MLTRQKEFKDFLAKYSFNGEINVPKYIPWGLGNILESI